MCIIFEVQSLFYIDNTLSALLYRVMFSFFQGETQLYVDIQLMTAWYYDPCSQKFDENFSATVLFEYQLLAYGQRFIIMIKSQ